MAITISSLTPTNPSTPVGGTISFAVSASTDTGNPLTYEWQYSTNSGVSYTSAGLTGNTSSSYTTSILTAAEDGLYWRVVISDSVDTVNSDEDPGIGDRILNVTAAATISLLSEPDETGYSLGAGANLTLTWTTTLLNSDISIPVTTLNATVQKSSDGVTWTDIGDSETGTGPISEIDGITYVINYDASYVVSSSPLAYGHEVSLTINNITFAINNYQYRLQITDNTASNSPVNTSSVTVIINPEITIIVQPGVALTDSTTASCYKTAISNTGDYKVSISALTTAGVGLGYGWQYSYLQSDGTYTDFVDIQDAIDLYHCKLKTGTSANSSILELERLIYFEEWRMRCVLTGANGETEVTSDIHSIFMTDSVVKPDDMVDVDALEDYYGDIVDRTAYTQYSIETANFNTSLDASRNTGLNGTLTMVIEESDDGGTTWTEVGITETYSPSYNQYYLNPSIDEPAYPVDLSYTTPPLRIADDNGNLFRTKVTSTAVYTLSGSTKTLTPIYSDNNATLNVYRQIFITGQPTSTTVYPNFDASFAVTATPSSTAALTYQWQRSNTNVAWTDITAANAGTKYSGYTTNLLTVSDVSSTDDSYYRVIINAPGTLSSVTTQSAELLTTDDFFTVLSSLNDYYVLQFTNVSWTVNAQSASLGTVSYQWQKSTNYNTTTDTGTWSNISGQTSSTYSINSVGSSDEAYYRCQVTSEGGTVDATNAVKLEVTAIAITILTNLPSSFDVLENAAQEVTYEVDAIASIGDAPTYQWQYSDDGGSTWNNYGTGYQGQTADDKIFIPNPIDKADDGRKVRCKIDAAEVPTSTYSNVATLNVKRRFTYFADSAVKDVVDGETFFLDLNPSFTGGTPTYQWYKGSSAISGANQSSYSFTAAAGNDGDVYKCQITLADVDQHEYSRNNVNNIVNKSSGDFTETVELNIVTAVAGIGSATSYTTEGVKSGAAIGTVICIPKKAGYVHNSTATMNDNTIYGHSRSGSITPNKDGNSTQTSGTAYTANKPSWVTDPNYVSPRWTNEEDGYPGYLELRGQWLKKADFPALYRVLGDAYGVTSTCFRLPFPIGKKLMGTGNVDNNSGSVSIEPLFAPDGTSGGDKKVPGSVGGVYNDVESKQLPPGSPGVGTDGTAGAPDPSTFTLGNFSTDGFTDVEATADTDFSGSYTYKVGPMLPWAFAGVPDHSHSGISAGFVEGFSAKKGSCNGQGPIDPRFYEVEPEGGSIASGPEGIAETERGRLHAHAVSLSTVEPGNNFTETHSDGIGPSGSAGESVTVSTNLQYTAGSSTPSFNIFLEHAPVTMTTATKSIFDGSLKFVLKNNESLPLLSPYFRLRYLIKAY